MRASAPLRRREIDAANDHSFELGKQQKVSGGAKLSLHPGPEFVFCLWTFILLTNHSFTIQKEKFEELQKSCGVPFGGGLNDDLSSVCEQDCFGIESAHWPLMVSAMIVVSKIQTDPTIDRPGLTCLPVRSRLSHSST